MGDQGGEPSMEDILSSIKRIIAEEGDPGAPVRGRRIGRPFPADRQPEAVAPPAYEPEIEADEDQVMPGRILELDHSFSRAPTVAEFPAPPQQQPEVKPETAPTEEAPPSSGVAGIDPTILSPRVAEATRGQLEALSRMIVKPDVSGSDTLEGLVREMLKPMLSNWLDANLPRIVEAMVSREIARISGRSDS